MLRFRDLFLFIVPVLASLVAAGFIATTVSADSPPPPPPRQSVSSVLDQTPPAPSVSFRDIATDPSSGLDYRRRESPSDDIFDVIKQQPLYTFDDVLMTPIKTRGVPGVALFDYDRDGDLDVYVTNGPDAANSLFQNRLQEDGALRFVDVAAAAGVDAVSQNSTGVCFGDLDNDGFQDLYVLGTDESNRLFHNRGDGHFEEIPWSGAEAGARSRTACAFGDVDNDGLLDILVGNSFDDWSNQLALFVAPFDLNEHNQLFLNVGDLRFTDVSAISGIKDQVATVPEGFGKPGLTWSIALVDLDLDGDVDMVTADDQGGLPLAKNGGVDRGLLHVFENDGGGSFTDVTLDAGTDRPGQWMGLSFGDLNCDGAMDFFGSNFGDYAFGPLPVPYERGDATSRWLLGAPQGAAGQLRFTDPGVGDLLTTPFGWATDMLDFDLDGDIDILFHGGLDVSPFVDASNAGVLLSNRGCSGGEVAFDVEREAFAHSTDHQRRTVQGAATGDLDNDGFVDIVSVSNFDMPEGIPLTPHRYTYGSPFDADASYVEVFVPTDTPFEWTYSGITFPDGTLSVEINSGQSHGGPGRQGNRGVSVELVGGAGRIPGAVSNRDGIGGVVSVTPHRGPTAMLPVGTTSYTSQSSTRLNFGLGRTRTGQIDIVWPGGIRNTLYGAHAGENIRFPEIPCDPDGGGAFREYAECVRSAVDAWRAEGELDRYERLRFLLSAYLAFFD